MFFIKNIKQKEEKTKDKTRSSSKELVLGEKIQNSRNDINWASAEEVKNER